MGLTPLAGVLMGNRCGDIDPSVVTYMEQKLGFHGQEMADYLNKKSGLLGISGVSSDMRDVDVYNRQGEDDAERQRGIHQTAALLGLDGGRIHQHEHMAVLKIDAAAFFLIERGAHEVRLDAQLGTHGCHFFLGGRAQMHPRAGHDLDVYKRQSLHTA